MKNRKFRAWDKDAERMIYSDQQYDLYYFEFDGGKLKAFTIHESPGTIHEPPQPYSTELDNLMDYIDSKDKNGKEIWEADIVKRIGDFGTIQYPDRRELIDVVEFKGGCFCPVCEEPSENFEIIGNIYENPELIEGRE